MCAFLVEKRTDLGFKDAPQIWLAAILALIGVGFLELPSVLSGSGDLLSAGDALSVLQAVGFGTSFYLTERMMQKEPTQALPITAAQVSVTALISAVWAICDGYAIGPFSGGWLLDETTRITHSIPGLFLDPTLRTVATAAVWTGLVTTAANRVAETIALGQITSSEASVLLATEPLWAALFGALLINEALAPEDFAGGALIVAACVTAATDRDTMRRFLRIDESSR
jgi:drug/metabolite transporter (DMT)-like permease